MGLEERLRRRFPTRTEAFSHGDFRVEVLLPLAADELIDEREFERDERLPYWAELWPSARALARHLLDGPLPQGPVLELGSGVALPSLALRSRGAAALATDYYPEALEFARVNALRNELPPPDTLLLDWREPPEELGRFPLVLAADVLYESRNAEWLAALLPRATAPDGVAWIADPGRMYRSDLEDAMRAAGWSVAELRRIREPSPELGENISSVVTILELRPPAPRS